MEIDWAQKTFGERLVYARKAKGLTQKQLAKLVGAKCRTLSNWETGQYSPAMSMIQKLTTSLKISEDWLMGNNNCPSTNKPPENQVAIKLNDRKLTKEERKFVADNSKIIDYVLRKQLCVKDFDEVYGTAALALCKAVKHYDRNKGPFYAVAFAFIKWAVYDFYEKEYRNSLHPLSLNQVIGSSDESDDEIGNLIQAPDEFEPLEYKILAESVYQKVECSLTNREKEVYRLWLHGEEDSKIAKQLGISLHAVRNNKYTANQKCRASLNPADLFS